MKLCILSYVVVHFFSFVEAGAKINSLFDALNLPHYTYKSDGLNSYLKAEWDEDYCNFSFKKSGDKTWSTTVESNFTAGEYYFARNANFYNYFKKIDLTFSIESDLSGTIDITYDSTYMNTEHNLANYKITVPIQFSVTAVREEYVVLFDGNYDADLISSNLPDTEVAAKLTEKHIDFSLNMHVKTACKARSLFDDNCMISTGLESNDEANDHELDYYIEYNGGSDELRFKLNDQISDQTAEMKFTVVSYKNKPLPLFGSNLYLTYKMTIKTFYTNDFKILFQVPGYKAITVLLHNEVIKFLKPYNKLFHLIYRGFKTETLRRFAVFVLHFDKFAKLLTNEFRMTNIVRYSKVESEYLLYRMKMCNHMVEWFTDHYPTISLPTFTSLNRVMRRVANYNNYKLVHYCRTTLSAKSISHKSYVRDLTGKLGGEEFTKIYANHWNEE